MISTKRIRSFSILFLSLITSLLITPALAKTRAAFYAEKPSRTDSILNEYGEDGQCVEIGSGSATDGGISNSGNNGASWEPSLAISPDGMPLVAWYGSSGSNPEIYIRRWDGTSWVEMGSGSASGGGISNTGNYSENPSLAIGGDGIPVVAWPEDTTEDNEIYIRRWDGTSWVEMGSGSASGGGISNNDGPSSSPSLAIGPDGKPVVAWVDQSYPHEIYVRRWDGASWVEIGSGSASGGGISDTDGNSFGPSLAIAPDGNPIVAWADGSGSDFGYPEIYVRRWDGTSWVEMGSGSASGGGISDNFVRSLYPSLAIGATGMPVVAWADDSAGNYQIYVRRWDGTSWVEMGSGSASGGGISDSNGSSFEPSLAIDPDGTPVIAWADDSSDIVQIYVRRWDGTSWVEMGSGSASGGGISNTDGESFSTSLAISSEGTAIIAWRDDSSGRLEIYVRRWQFGHQLFLPAVLHSK
jgi:hypothetical protein